MPLVGGRGGSESGASIGSLCLVLQACYTGVEYHRPVAYSVAPSSYLALVHCPVNCDVGWRAEFDL